ncbi:MAG: MMPL family transporter [Acidobacteriota bacterium]|nr:MMPL family transporter [Acidobacteriota bacterium]
MVQFLVALVGLGVAIDYSLLMIFRFREELARDDVEQILREAPHRRRVQEQLVRIEIQTAVKSVPVVEVPVAHQDLELLQRVERLAAKIVLACHVIWPLVRQQRHCDTRPFLQRWLRRRGR